MSNIDCARPCRAPHIGPADVTRPTPGDSFGRHSGPNINIALKWAERPIGAGPFESMVSDEGRPQSSMKLNLHTIRILIKVCVCVFVCVCVCVSVADEINLVRPCQAGTRQVTAPQPPPLWPAPAGVAALFARGSLSLPFCPRLPARTTPTHNAVQSQGRNCLRRTRGPVPKWQTECKLSPTRRILMNCQPAPQVLPVSVCAAPICLPFVAVGSRQSAAGAFSPKPGPVHLYEISGGKRAQFSNAMDSHEFNFGYLARPRTAHSSLARIIRKWPVKVAGKMSTAQGTTTGALNGCIGASTSAVTRAASRGRA